MRWLRRNLIMGASAAVTAGLACSPASRADVAYPANLHVEVSLPFETVTKIEAYAYPLTGDHVGKIISIPTDATGPYFVDVTADGGNPYDVNDPGISYRPEIYVYLYDSPDVHSYLYIQRNAAVILDNTPTLPSASVAANFYYPTVRWVNVSVSMPDGVIDRLEVHASSQDIQRDESYVSYGSSSFEPTEPSVVGSVPMIPNSRVTVYAIAYLTASGLSHRSQLLAAQTVNLSQDSVNVHWDIDRMSLAN